jgi:hypothetical protein
VERPAHGLDAIPQAAEAGPGIRVGTADPVVDDVDAQGPGMR